MRSWKIMVLTILVAIGGLMLVADDGSAAQNSLKFTDVSYDESSGVVSFEGYAPFDGIVKVRVSGSEQLAIKEVSVVNGAFSGSMDVGYLSVGAYYVVVSTANSLLYDSFTLNVRDWVHVGSISYDASRGKLNVSGSSSSAIVEYTIAGMGKTLRGYIPASGGFSESIKVELDSGSYVFTAYVAGNGAVSQTVDFNVYHSRIEADANAVSVYVGSQATLSFELTECTYDQVEVSTNPSGIITVSEMSSSCKIVVTGVSVGVATIAVSVNNSVCEIQVSVLEKPSEVKEYSFFIQMKYDADKVRHSTYTQEMLEAGFTITAKGTNAADALAKACAANNIPLTTYSGGDILGWINGLFGLGDVDLGNGLWKYWVQYKDGVYNNWTLGHYTDGGNFSLIYDITDVNGGSTTPGGDSGSKGEEITEDGGNKTTESETKKNDDGSTTGTTKETTEYPDGSKEQTETKVDTSADGSETKTTTTTTKTDADGNKETSETVSSVKKDKDGTTTEERTENVISSDGTKKESSSTIVTDRNGNVKETTSTEIKDADGRTTGSSVKESTITKTSTGTMTETTETSKDKDGNVTGIKETQTSVSGNKTKVEETSKDANGNVIGSMESTTTTTDRTLAGGKTQTTTVVESETKDSNGDSTGSSTESTILVKKDGKIESTTAVKTVKDADGNVTEESETSVSSTTDSKGKTTETTYNQKKDGVETDRTTTSFVSSDKKTETTGTETTITTSEGKTSERSEETRTVLDNGTRTESSAVKTVTDKDGKVVDKVEEKKASEDIETETEKTSTSSTETIRNGSTESKESSKVESKETSGLVTTVDVEKKDGTVTKAESTTTVPAEGGNLDSDAVQKAIDQSNAAMDAVSVDSKDIAKTIEVRNSDGAKVSISPDAIGRISDHGAGLVIGNDDESIILDDDIVRNLDRGSEGDVSIGMNEGVHDDLNEKQKEAVGGNRFITLDAFIGQDRIHDLGGIANIVLGFSIEEGRDADDLRVFYVDDDGEKHPVDSTFMKDLNRLSLRTTHFSVFMIAFEETATDPDDDDGEEEGGSDALMYGTLAAIVLIVVAAVAIIYRRKA